jgi:hypothetical protein
MRRTIMTVASTVVLITTGDLLWACNSERSPAAPPSAALSNAVPSQVGAAARFHASNPVDWVGRAHTTLVHGYAHRMLSRHNYSGDICADIIKYVAGRRDLFPESAPPTNALYLPAAAGLAGTFCEKSPLVRRLMSTAGNALTASTSNGLRPRFAASRSPATPEDSGVTISADAQDLVDEISTAVDMATSANNLASLLSPIVATADTLSTGDDAEIVEAVASVAQSSYEDWTGGEADSYDSGFASDYGSCYENSTESEQDTFDDCVGPKDLPEPTMFAPPSRRRLNFRFASVIHCSTDWNWGELVGMDVGGALLGARVGVMAGGIGALPGALDGGATGSMVDAVAQSAEHLWCAIFH